MMSNKSYYIIIISAIVVIIDQITKQLVKNSIKQPIDIIKRILSITYTQNTGAGFSILQGFNIAIIMFTVAIILGLFYYYKKIPDNKLVWVSIALMLGGAIGNLIDRLLYGYVIDFIDFKVGLVFNFADFAITIGAIILMLYLVKKK